MKLKTLVLWIDDLTIDDEYFAGTFVYAEKFMLLV